MNKFAGITIRKLNQVDPNDKRGPTYEWCKNIMGQQVTIYKRKKGSSCGNHFHKGDDDSKNPERFLLIRGSLELRAINSLNQKMNKKISAVSEILIYPNVLHSFFPLTDVIFIEYRSSVYDKDWPDVYSENDYFDYINSKNTKHN